MKGAEDFGRALIAEAERRLLAESLPRLERCLSLLTEEEIWQRPNAATPSVGNLILHLCGNVRQWIVAALGGAPDVRRRAEEFNPTDPIPADELRARLTATLRQAHETLRRLDPASLLEKRPVQGFEETGIAILVHVVEHFSYHVGQISFRVKTLHGVDLGYYAGQDLNRTRGSGG